jgi:hypothetical protein
MNNEEDRIIIHFNKEYSEKIRLNYEFSKDCILHNLNKLINKNIEYIRVFDNSIVIETNDLTFNIPATIKSIIWVNSKERVRIY